MDLTTVLTRICFDFNQPFLAYKDDSIVMSNSKNVINIRLDILSVPSADGTEPDHELVHPMHIEIQGLPEFWDVNAPLLFIPYSEALMYVHFQGTKIIYSETRLLAQVIEFVKERYRQSLKVFTPELDVATDTEVKA